jgi:hypothetical protein
MYNRLRGHLNDYKLLVDEQIGFRKNLTTEKANYELLNEMYEFLMTDLLCYCGRDCV